MNWRKKTENRRATPRAPELTIEQILGWADEWFDRAGKWPGQCSGRIPGGLGET
jgi:hypothetical protein